MRLQLDIARVGEGAGSGRECGRFPQRGGWLGGDVGVREDHEPALPAAARALADPRMSGINLELH